MHLLLEEKQCNKVVAELVKFIDKDANKIIIVLSGEKEGMRRLVLTNEDFNYRFPTWFDFEDYDYNGLCDIAINTLNRKSYSLEREAEVALKKAIIGMYGNPNLVLSNGLMIKQYLDSLIRAQSIRVCDEDLSKENINVITAEDIITAQDKFLLKNSIK